VFEVSIGTLVAHLLNQIATMILAKEDIKASDAEQMVRLLRKMLGKLREVMTVSQEDVWRPI
jgi:hypothetical protein